MSVARRFAVAFAVVGLGVLAYAVPASATESGSSGGACITNPTPDQFVATLEPHHGIARVRAADGVNLCADVLLSAYTVPATWVGQDFDETAIPQTIYGKSTVGHVEGTKRIELSSTAPTPTPTETSPAAPTPTETSPAAESASPAAVIPPTEGTPGPVAEVPTLPTANTTPVLASTGSNATIPLIGIGTALVGVGVLLSLLGRRRKTA